MALEIGAILPLAGLATFWTGFGFGYFHGGREESRRQLLKLERRRELENTWTTGQNNKQRQRSTKRQEPRHVRIQAQGEKTPSKGETRRVES